MEPTLSEKERDALHTILDALGGDDADEHVQHAFHKVSGAILRARAASSVQEKTAERWRDLFQLCAVGWFGELLARGVYTPSAIPDGLRELSIEYAENLGGDGDPAAPPEPDEGDDRIVCIFCLVEGRGDDALVEPDGESCPVCDRRIVCNRLGCDQPRNGVVTPSCEEHCND